MAWFGGCRGFGGKSPSAALYSARTGRLKDNFHGSLR